MTDYALTRTEQKFKDLNALLTRAKPQLSLALPKHLSPERMLRVALTSVRMQPKLLECDQTSFLSAVMMSAQLGLEPDGMQGLAWLLPYWNSKRKCSEVQLRIGYRGLMELARRSGEIANWWANAVREQDAFEYEYGTGAYLRHRPARGKRGPLVNAYAGATLKSGGHVFRVLDDEEIEIAKKRSASRDREGHLIGPWVTDEEEMWIKTAIRRVAKMLPSSPEFQTAVMLDEQAERGVPQEIAAIVEPLGALEVEAEVVEAKEPPKE